MISDASGIWAATYQITSSGSNLGDPDCDGLAANYPVFVVDYNASMTFGAIAKQFIGRHEIGHAIGLPDVPTVACWQDGSGFWLPLMNDGLYKATYCPSYPTNYTATFNEAVAAVLRSGW